MAVHVERRIERPGECPIVILLPALRCDSCRATTGEVLAVKVCGETPMVMFVEERWREVDKPEISDADLDKIEPPYMSETDEDIPKDYVRWVEIPERAQG